MKTNLNMNEFEPLMPKEFLQSIRFSEEEVLGCPERIKDRAEKLIKAVETLDGLKMVHANIWEATDINVILMDGITIPVHCIREVSFHPQLTDDFRSVISDLPTS
jgi:hypothetical protein